MPPLRAADPGDLNAGGVFVRNRSISPRLPLRRSSRDKLIRFRLTVDGDVSPVLNQGECDGDSNDRVPCREEVPAV